MSLEHNGPRNMQRAKLKREKKASLGEIDPVPKCSDQMALEKNAVFELTAVCLDNAL